MDHVEQAVFTSAETSKAAGYQLVAKSDGILEEDARALSTWGPSHGALLASGRHASSVNFHPLPSGRYCVSRTTASGNEYSGRGTRVYTQCFVVSREILERFANNPFAVVRAASGSGLLKQHARVPASLEPVSFVGRAPVIDPSLLSRARRELGPNPIARLVQEALRCRSMAIAGVVGGDLAVGALLNCLPPCFRTEFSFSTGLHTSARRPYRVVVLGDDAEERRRACQTDAVALIDLGDKTSMSFAPTEDWARAIYQIVEMGRSSLLGRWFDKLSDDVSIDRLNEIGRQLLEELGNAPAPGISSPSSAEMTVSQPEVVSQDGEPAGNPRSDPTSSSSPRIRQTAHAAHSQFSGNSLPEERATGPAAVLSCDHPEVVASLETLDDLVFDAIKGDESALARLRTAWPNVKAELGEELLTQSREQYLRYALQVWEKCVETTDVRPTDKAVNALEVICVLFDEV